MPACKVCGAWFVKIKPHEELCDKCECALYRLSGYVAPVVNGRWERRFCHPMRDGEWQYICSVCKNDNYWRNNVCHQKHRYCPNCGAKMDGGESDEAD